MYTIDQGSNYQLQLPAVGLTLHDLILRVDGHLVEIKSQDTLSGDQEARSDLVQQIRLDSLRKVCRTFRLPQDCNPKTLTTSLTHGMLEINVEKLPPVHEFDVDQHRTVGQSTKTNEGTCGSCSMPKHAMMFGIIILTSLIGAAYMVGPIAVATAALVILKGLALGPLLLLEAIFLTGFTILRLWIFFVMFSIVLAPFPPLLYAFRPHYHCYKVPRCQAFC